ncbi:hypothetical protein F2Q70_00003820 [Brassica cretica]|uniref:Uncharacterized protein n=1 Tax=Brassica cretica TaxID=69181 RepID=A0A8S9J123_BRACR|nr:hypothetical protein F2Q70_00003820 [Brassica cretica]
MHGLVVSTFRKSLVATLRSSGTDARSLRSNRASALARARLLRSDQAEHAFGRCVATLFELLSDVSGFIRKAFHGRGHLSGSDSDFSGRSAGLCCRPSLLSRETSSSPSLEGAGSSRCRVPVLFCTGHCSGSWDRGRNSARYGNSRRLGRSRCFGLTCWIVHDFDSRRR